MKRCFKGTFAAVLAAVLTVSLAACGNAGGAGGGKRGDTPGGGDAFVYVPEFLSLGDETNLRISSSVFEGGKLYYSGYVFDEETMISKRPLYRYDLEAGSAEEIKLNQEGQQDAWMQEMAVDPEGNLYIIWQQSYYDEARPEEYRMDMLLEKYDPSGSTVFSQNITQEMKSGDDYSYVQRMAVDGEGRTVLVCGGGIAHLYDSDGKYLGQMEMGNDYVDIAFRSKDGKVYIAYNDWMSDQRGYTLKEVNVAGKTLVDAGLISFGNINSLSAGSEGKLLINDRVSLYEYDIASGESEELLNWLDCDINGDYVQMVGAAEDGRLVAVISDWQTGATEAAYLKKTKASEVVQKEEVVIGTLYMGQELRAAAVAFNKSNEKYHVSIREYMDRNSDMTYEDAITNLNNEITSGNCPDMLALDMNLSIENLVAKDVLEDLNPFLDSSSRFGRDSFVESALRGYTYDGVLVGIPKTFSLQTMAAKTSQVGEKMGWSVKDIMDFAAEHPGAKLIEYAGRSEVMFMLMTFNQDAFIDWEKGTCSFDSDEFKQMLEFSASFPEQYDWEGEQDSTPTLLATGKLLLYTDSISDCNQIQMAEAMFNEPVTYIGYPTLDGSVGCVMGCNGAIAITKKSKNKEGAWAFIEGYLDKKDDMFSWGFYSEKERLEEQIAEAMKVEYVLDENGEPLLDENGDPIQRSQGGIGWGDWEYEYHSSTEEEMELLRQLIDVAIPMRTTNSQVLTIIQEEAEGYYSGQKSLDEVAALIQSRMSMYVGENS